MLCLYLPDRHSSNWYTMLQQTTQPLCVFLRRTDKNILTLFASTCAEYSVASSLLVPVDTVFHWRHFKPPVVTHTSAPPALSSATEFNKNSPGKKIIGTYSIWAPSCSWLLSKVVPKLPRASVSFCCFISTFNFFVHAGMVCLCLVIKCHVGQLYRPRFEFGQRALLDLTPISGLPLNCLLPKKERTRTVHTVECRFQPGVSGGMYSLLSLRCIQ